MELAEIRGIHRDRAGHASVRPEEVAWFGEVIARHRPRSLVEVGTASGLTTVLLARLLEEHGGERVVTLDHDNTFLGDPSKENGYLIPQLYPDGPVRIDRRPFTTSLSLPAAGETFDMAFVDANHQHPWPLLDTLCVATVLTGPRVVLHDDLNLHRKQPKGRGIGPKHLFDQFPESHRERAPVLGGNVCALSLDLPQERLEAIAADAFYIPWTLTSRLGEEQLGAFRAVLREHYSSDLLAVFDTCAERFNVPSGGRNGRRGARA